jgi:hypothetical protein
VPEVWDQTKLEEAGRMMEEMKRSHAGQASQTGQSAR